MADGGTFIDELLAEDPATVDEVDQSLGVKFRIRRFALLSLLEKAASVLPTREAMTALLDFKITVDTAGNRVEVVGSDVEMTVIASTEIVEIDRPGVAYLPAKRLLSIVSAADEGTVEVDVVGTMAHIAIGPTSWKLRIASGDDYPRLPLIEGVEFVAVNRVALLSALRAVRYAACRDVTRGSLNMVDIRDGKITAADGARFQQVKFPLNRRFQIPLSAVDNLFKLLRSSEVDEIEIGEDNKKLVFKFGFDIFLANKLVALFPDLDAQFLRPVMENKSLLTVDRHSLIGAIKRVRINADKNTSAIALRLRTNELAVIARDVLGNEASETIEAEWNDGNRTIVLNHEFLTQLLLNNPGDNIAFYLAPDQRQRRAPVMVKSEDGGIGVVYQTHTDWVME